MIGFQITSCNQNDNMTTLNNFLGKNNISFILTFGELSTKQYLNTINYKIIIYVSNEKVLVIW